MTAISCIVHVDLKTRQVSADCLDLIARDDPPPSELELRFAQCILVALQAMTLHIAGRYKSREVITLDEIRTEAQAKIADALARYCPPDSMPE